MKFEKLSISKSKRGTEKKDIALIQLRRAIQLFNQGDFVSSTTLAGAEEEILGKIALKRTGTNALDVDLHFWTQMADFFGKTKPSKKKVYDVLNKSKNELKHNDSGENKYVETDFEFDALCLIDRAIRNYCLAYNRKPNDRIINKYMNVHWI